MIYSQPVQSTVQAQNILVTSSSNKTPLIRAFQKAGRSLDKEIEIVAGDISRDVVSRFVADFLQRFLK